MPDGTTTIEIFESDRDLPESLRRCPDENESLSPVALADIQASLDEIRRGEFVTHEALKRDLGIE